MSHRATLSVSIVGYSRLMRVEPALTKATLDDIASEIIQPNLTRFGGRLMEHAEEHSVIEFQDSKQALLFAVVFQLAMRNRNHDIREDRQILYRVGIDSLPAAASDADIEAAERTASDLSELTEAGRICISGSTFENLSGGMDLTFVPIQEPKLVVVREGTHPHEVKLDAKAAAITSTAELPQQPNRRIGILVAAMAVVAVLVAGTSLYYSLSTNRSATGGVQTLPQKPSIAVMPFENLSTSTEGSMFAHGITASIISALAQVPQLFVISSSSAFSFAEQFGGTREVGAEFGVRYGARGVRPGQRQRHQGDRRTVRYEDRADAVDGTV